MVNSLAKSKVASHPIKLVLKARLCVSIFYYKLFIAFLYSRIFHFYAHICLENSWKCLSLALGKLTSDWDFTVLLLYFFLTRNIH